ncbi:MAG: hypothetical protein AAF264_02575 [Pseudomonadota bacterium]
MAEEVTEVLVGVAAVRPALPMASSGLTGLGMQDVVAAGNMSTALEGVMANLSWKNQPGGGMISLRDEVSGMTGEVGHEKVGMVTEMGASPAPQSTEDRQGQMIDRINDLYSDMTVYQVAWSVARRLQQDTSQLPRGQ